MNEVQKKVVLVADDDAEILTIVSEAIRCLGVEVVQARDGSQAKNIFETLSVDLAVLDISMPGFTGIEVCAFMKASPIGELIPVILLTAKDSLEDKVKGLESGADEYLTKPFQYRELQARVKACLRIRDLNLKLKKQSDELRSLQDKLIEQERQLVAGQIGGTAAHQLGQPLAALTLNIYLIEQLPKDDIRFATAVKAMQEDLKKMGELLSHLRTVNVSTEVVYFGDTKVFKFDKES